MSAAREYEPAAGAAATRTGVGAGVDVGHAYGSPSDRDRELDLCRGPLGPLAIFVDGNPSSQEAAREAFLERTTLLKQNEMQWPADQPVPSSIWPLGTDPGLAADLLLWRCPRESDENLQREVDTIYALCTKSLGDPTVPEGTVGINLGVLAGLDMELAFVIESSPLAAAAFAGDEARVGELLAELKGGGGRGVEAGADGRAELELETADGAGGGGDAAASPHCATKPSLDLALAAAAAGGRSAIVARLLDMGADPNAGLGRALLLAVFGGSYARGRRWDANVGKSLYGRIGDYLQTVEALVQRGSCPLYRGGLSVALVTGYRARTDFKRDDRWGMNSDVIDLKDVEHLVSTLVGAASRCACSSERKRALGPDPGAHASLARTFTCN
eukprot:tig00020509_g9745.t1